MLIYILDNKLGGVTSLNVNLASNCPYPHVKQSVIHIDQHEWEMARANTRFPVDNEYHFEYSGKENIYHVLHRLRQCIPDEEGALVVNYGMEMSMLDHYPVRQTVYQLVHDEYNVRLAERYSHVVDLFICHNRHIEQRLQQVLPGRTSDIRYLPHGVSIPVKYSRHLNESKPLKAVFLGRMTEAKGIFDLPRMDELLKEKGVDVDWTCIGRGPQLDALKKAWAFNNQVRYLSPATNEEVMDICAEQDVFVLPTRFEGSPVSLLEAMSAGLVPVISALPGGIMEAVHSDNGYTVPVADIHGFARAITELHADRKRLQRMGEQSRLRIINHYDVRKTAARYHELFADFKNLYRPKELKKLKIGARLDKPWMPSWLTKRLRSLATKK